MSRGWRLVAAGVFALLPAAQAQEKKGEEPRITALVPLSISPGATTTVRIRGSKLAEATAVEFSSSGAALPAEFVSAKKADVPNGLDAKAVGDSQVEVKVTAPADLQHGAVTVAVVTPQGRTAPQQMRVLASEQLTEEKEPNGGFREAQEIAFGATMRGVIKEEKDVDVYQFTGRAGAKIAAEVFASRQASLLDAVLTLYGARGVLLATNDDAETHDAELRVTLPEDGVYFLSVTDAHDRGTTWHAYELEVKETP